MGAESWVLLETYSSRTEAEIVAGLLRSENVPVQLESLAALPGLDSGAHLRVPERLLHRARWVLAQPRLSDAELESLALAQRGDAVAKDTPDRS
jgi:hypothetical protein